jgi:hypothetical protein
MCIVVTLLHNCIVHFFIFGAHIERSKGSERQHRERRKIGTKHKLNYYVLVVAERAKKNIFESCEALCKTRVDYTTMPA